MSNQLASPVMRFAALVIDSILIGIVAAIIAAVTGQTALGTVASWLIGVAYHAYFLTQQNGQTPGKMLLGLRVVKVSGAQLTVLDAAIRYTGYYINTFVIFIGWIWAFFDSRRQGWHDKLAGTIVVKA